MLKKIISGTLAIALTLGTVMFFSGFNMVAANADPCNPITVVVVPPTITQIADPFVHPGNSANVLPTTPNGAIPIGNYPITGKGILNSAQVDALLTSASSIKKAKNIMSQIDALLAATPDGLSTSLSAANLKKYNNLVAKLNALIPQTGSSTSTSASTTKCVDPVLTASNSTIKVGDVFDVMKGVKATQAKKDITNLVTVTGSINTSVPGLYKITYSVPGCNGNVNKTVSVNVLPGTPVGPTKCIPGST